MTRWVCRWKPLWVPRGDTFQKAYLEDWEQEDDDHSYTPGEEGKNNHTGHARSPELQHLGAYKQFKTTVGAPHANYQLLVAVPLCRNRLGNFLEIQTYQQSRRCSIFGTLLGAPVPSKTMFAIFIHPIQFGIFPERFSLPYPDEEILFWVRGRRLVRARRFFSLGEGGSRGHLGTPPCRREGFQSCVSRGTTQETKEEYSFDTDMPNRLTEQKRLSI